MEKIAKRIAQRHLATTKNKASVEQTNGARITAEDVERIVGRRRAIYKGTCKLRPTASAEMTNEVRFSMMTPGWTRLIGVCRIYWASDSGAAVPWAEVTILSEQVPVPVKGDANEKGYIPC
jgi:hypothetical protein